MKIRRLQGNLTRAPNRWKIRLYSLVIALVVFAVSFTTYLANPRLLSDVEGRLLDMRFLLRGAEAPSDQVAIVAVDDASLTELGRWPWPRARMAQLIENMVASGAAVVGLDIVFSEPEAEQTLAQLSPLLQRDETLAAQVKEGLTRYSGDQILADTLRNTGNVVNGQFFFTSEELAPELTEEARQQQRRLLGSSAVEVVKTKTADFPLFETYGVTTNIPLIANAGPGAGYFNFPPGRDGLIRISPLIMRYGERLYPSLALKTLAHLLQVPIIVEVEDYGVDHIRLGSHRIYTDEVGAVTVNFRGPAQTIPTYSAADVLEGRIGVEQLGGRLVLLGVTAVGVYDAHSTSFGASFPGLEIQANVLENLIAGDSLQRTNLELLADTLTMAVLILVLAIVFPLLGSVRSQSVFSFLVIAFYLGINHWLFVTHDLWIVMVYPLFAWAFAYLSLLLFFSLAVERRFSNVRDAFKSYLHPTLVEQLTHRPELHTFGGESKVLTLLFSDIRSFTEKSEKLDPEQLADFLKCYMDPMTEIVFKNRGTLDKYIGDAVMAFYGAPFPSDVHPQRACHTALQMLRRTELIFNDCPELKHIAPVEIGVGIHTGPVVVGNFGSSYRFSYTALGDTVNLASRLEGLCKRYKVKAIVSETTFEAVKDEFCCRELDRVRVKGKTQPLRIYELISEGNCAEADPRYMQRWQAALDVYHDQRWQEALELFSSFVEDYPKDEAGQLYRKRSEDYLMHPPESDWDGVFTYREK